MSQDPYSVAITSIFSSLNHESFTVHYNPRIIFICGGPIESDTSAFPASLRERILNHLDSEHSDVEKNTIVAENFTDYFQNGFYKNLLQFEEDIANVSSLIVICLESEGSLVEFGLFCNHPLTSEKLQVYVPEEHYNGINSFVTLGPLAELRAKSEDAVLAYPFPDPSVLHYEHIDIVVGDLLEKLDNCPKSEQFDSTNSGHLAFLTHDIISLCEPIKKQEIASSLNHLGLGEITDSRLTQLLYLLSKVGLVGYTTYSHVDYYYAINTNSHRLTFGRNKEGTIFDRTAKFIEVKQSFAIAQPNESQTTKKRRLAFNKINQERQ